jgi:hypothetical protein
MKEKAAKSERKSKGAVVGGIGGDGSGKERDRRDREVRRAEGREKSLKVFEKSRAVEVGFGVVGMGKPWSTRPGVESQGKDRSVAPPALPVPIASFTI